MKILFAGNKQRGIGCLEAVCKKHEILGVIASPESGEAPSKNAFAEVAKKMGFTVHQPEDVNDSAFVERLQALKPDLTVLAGYGQIVRGDFIRLARFGCINLHAGKLPQYRGSSPMNWVLINGESSFTITIIQVDEGVDTGDILGEKTFSIQKEDTIRELHQTANAEFPKLLDRVVSQIEYGCPAPRIQDPSLSSYYPLRFPDDGLILWDMLTAEQVHNRTRALTDPYPGAFTYGGGQRFKILKTRLADRDFFGEPGRIYLKKNGSLLVCAIDKCLWVDEIVAFDTGEDAYTHLARYGKFATVRDQVKALYEN